MLLALSSVLWADPLVELSTPQMSWQGRDIAHTNDACWLEDRQGAYQLIDLTKVTSFRVVAAEYRPVASHETAAALRAELGRTFEVTAIGKYVIAAPPGRGKQYGALLDEVHRSARTFFSRRGFQLSPSTSPLVVIIFSTQAEFRTYVQRDVLATDSNLRGLYDPKSNRMFFYDSVDAAGGVPQSVRLTVAHEAVHQFCFNSGLTGRLTQLPVWLVEGLAINLELAASRNGNGSRMSRVHAERLERFQQFVGANPEFDLAEFLVNDTAMFQAEPLDAYAVSWAITFYLIETRSADLTSYLKMLQRRGPFDTYPGSDRIADFGRYFGKDISLFHAGLERFIGDLE